MPTKKRMILRLNVKAQSNLILGSCELDNLRMKSRRRDYHIDGNTIYICGHTKSLSEAGMCA